MQAETTFGGLCSSVVVLTTSPNMIQRGPESVNNQNLGETVPSNNFSRLIAVACFTALGNGCVFLLKGLNDF